RVGAGARAQRARYGGSGGGGRAGCGRGPAAPELLESAQRRRGLQSIATGDFWSGAARRELSRATECRQLLPAAELTARAVARGAGVSGDDRFAAAPSGQRERHAFRRLYGAEGRPDGERGLLPDGHARVPV